MLTELSIENFAIIDRLLLRFSDGFTVLTGETGAGKSIIIDALHAALGAKVPSDMVRSDAASAAVEAVFDLDETAVEVLGELLAEYGVEEDGCLILRREISPGGRSTSRLNGRAVPMAVLGAIGGALVDIHGQSEHLSILRPDRQLEVLDRYGGLSSRRSAVAESVKRFTRLRRELEELIAGQRDAEQRLDLLRFQVGEIEAARLREGEEEQLIGERNLLTNAERLTQLSARAYDALQGNASGALDTLADASAAIRDLAAIDPSASLLAERLESTVYELQDVAQEVRQYRDAVEYDPLRLDVIEERLDSIARLARKYGPGVADVMAFGQRARAEMEAVENLDDRRSKLETEVATAGSEAADRASLLSSEREHAAQALVVAMRDALQGLGLKGTSFEVELTRTPSPDGLELSDGGRYACSPSGVDLVSFMVSFNRGEPLRPLERVASGGETSRFLLALKSVLAQADRIPTLVFDEVDVGVGGRRAMEVGERMRSLGTNHQVVSITHLPQIAALADQHITVSKAVRDGRTTVDVRLLEPGDRVVELAEMMTGTGTEAARRNAEELLDVARRDR